DWQFLPKLTKANVWDSFVLFTLLEDHTSRSTRLSIPHGGEQAERFEIAMQERNARIVHEGQPELTHACNKCTRIYEDDDGGHSKVEVVVKRYCEAHDDYHNICAVVGCTSRITAGSMTCSDPQHSAMEALHIERGKSIFRLR
ncbi:uncharacterized protein STEHIDRAFT_37420, partial [Stereum hirsutum FP-91666 SS1]|uniref:uncharacterized protein n=1 Tax=Stereum hirsutum (strain FP-91666) TaxID=721885 RepID=UPI000440F1D7